MSADDARAALRETIRAAAARIGSLSPSRECLCTCGPAYHVGGEAWAYSSFYGWHNPAIEHDALWPVQP